MKKIILTLSFLSLFCISCSKNAPESIEAETKAQVEQQTQETPKPAVEEKKAEEPVAQEKIDDSVQEVQEPVADRSVTEIKIDIKNEAGIFDGTYPSFNIPEIDQDIKKEIDTAVKSMMEKFLRAVRELDDDEPVDLANIPPATPGSCEEFGGCNGFHVSYEVVQNTKDSIDIYLDFSIYFAGAAHPVSSIYTLMYDVKTGKRINAKSMFKDWNKALQIMSSESRKQIREELGDIRNDDMLNEGTEPNDENFQNILRTPKGIRIYFGQYAVAPYAAGMQIVNIPMSAFE